MGWGDQTGFWVEGTTDSEGQHPNGRGRKGGGLRMEVETKYELNAHKKHAACNPCTAYCPHCGKATILAGFPFHVKQCGARKQESEHALNPARAMETATRTQYPASSAALDRSNREPAGRAGVRRRTRRVAATAMARGGDAQRDPMVLELDIADDVVALGVRKELALPVAADDHKNHDSCNPCTKACPICHWTTILSGYEFHVKACAAKQEQRDIIDDPVRDAVASVALQYPASHRALEQARASEVGQTVARMRRANIRELRNAIEGGKRKGEGEGGEYVEGQVVGDPMDHTTHVTCCLRDRCAVCAIECVTCGQNVLATGYHPHRAKCSAKYIGQTQGGGAYKAKVTQVLEEYGNEPLFSTLRELPNRRDFDADRGRGGSGSGGGGGGGGGGARKGKDEVAAQAGGDAGSGNPDTTARAGRALANMLRKQKKQKKNVFRTAKRLR